MASRFSLVATRAGLATLIQRMGLDQSRAFGTIGSAGYWVQDLITTPTFGGLYREIRVEQVTTPDEVTGTLQLFTT